MDSDDWTGEDITRKILGFLSLIFGLWQIRTKSLQFWHSRGKCEFLKNLWNLLDITSLSLVFVVQIHTNFRLSSIEIEKLRVMAAMASFSLIIKLYDWLRLFEKTAFFVLLIGRTIRDIRWFLLLFGVALLQCGVPLSLLGLSRQDETESLIEENFGFWIIDAIYDQYLLSLGEFQTLKAYSSGSDSSLVLIIFTFATFFTSVTMLNMIIAIMGDSFANFIEYREVNGIKTKLAILGEQAPMLAQIDKVTVTETVMIVVQST